MGIEPDIEYGNNCLLCWAAGLTPKKVWVKFSGIQKSPNFPLAPPPPNGTFVLTQTAQACQWGALAGIWSIGYHANGGGTGIAALQFPFPEGFQFTSIFRCLTAGPNDFINPILHPYILGNAKVAWQ